MRGEGSTVLSTIQHVDVVNFVLPASGARPETLPIMPRPSGGLSTNALRMPLLVIG
jgi:hypothetical protein